MKLPPPRLDRAARCSTLRTPLRMESLEDRCTPATFVVNSTLDLPVNLGDAVVTLRDAIAAANTNVAVSPGGPVGEIDGDAIVFATGVFGGGGATISLAEGDLLISDDVAIDGATGDGGGATLVTIDGGAASRIFVVNTVGFPGVSNLVALSGLTLQNGNGTGSNSTDNGRGGAILLASASNATLTNLTVQNNTVNALNGATDGGGGVYSLTSTLVVTNSTFLNNTLTGSGASGGAIFQNGGTLTVTGGTFGATGNANTAVRAGGAFEINSVASNSLTTITNASVQSNTAGVNGGGLHITTDETTVGPITATIRIQGGNFSNNIAGNEGGGLWNDFQASMTITGTLISGNTANGTANDSGGGGVFTQGGQLTISSATISDNTVPNTAGSGGGILVDGGSLVVNGGLISNNTAARAGGGIEATAKNRDVSTTLTNVTISGNDANINGGGVHVTDNPIVSPNLGTSTFTMIGGSLSGNTAAQEGGGIWNDLEGTMTLTNVAITSNTASGTGVDQGGGGVFNNGGITHLNNTTISSNIANGAAGSGGGILNDGGTLTVTGGTIASNIAVRAGGGIEATAQNSASSVNLTDVTLVGNAVGNSPGNGGGIHVTDTVGVAFISTFTVSGGLISGNLANQEGGGLWNDAGGTMTITGTTISGNVANAANAGADAQGGGGLFNNGGTVILSGASITGNSVTGSLGTDDGGGGILNDGRNNPGTITLTNTTISGNTASPTNGNGGGVLNIGTSSATSISFTGGTIANNSAARAGGGIENIGGNVALTNTTATGNSAGINGGGLHISGAGTVSVESSTFSSNVAGNEGGGLWNSSAAAATITVSNSTISGNQATFGGGLFNDGAAGTLSISNSTISNNQAGVDGGGIDSEGGTVTITTSTLAGNTAGANGGGLNLDSATTTTLANSIIGDNAAASGPDINGSVFANYSLIEETTGAIISGANNLNADPLLGALAENGGPTLTQIPLPGSPVLNAGDPGFTPPPNTDQRGFARVVGGRLDLGAVEVAVSGPNALLAVGGSLNGQATLYTPNAQGEYGTPIQTPSLFSGFNGNVRTATGDVDGDGTADIVLVTGPGTPIRFAVISGADNTTVLLAPTAPFAGSESFMGGGYAATGDFDGDGRAEIVVSPDLGGGPRVTIFSLDAGGMLNTRANFLGIQDTNFFGGARVAIGDVNNDGTPDLLVAAGFSGGPRVALFDGATVLGTPTRLVSDFFAFPGQDAVTLRNGVFAALGDIDGDGFADLIFGGGPGGAPRVFILSGALVSANDVAGAQAAPIANFFVANNSSDRGGVRVATKDADGDVRADLAVGSGTLQPANVRIYLGADFTGTGEPTSSQDIPVFSNINLLDGVFVG